MYESRKGYALDMAKISLALLYLGKMFVSMGQWLSRKAATLQAGLPATWC